MSYMPFNPRFLKSYQASLAWPRRSLRRQHVICRIPLSKKFAGKILSSQFVRTKLVQGESTALLRTRLSPATIKTSTLGAQRMFSSFSSTFQRSAARTATQNQSLLSCTVFITSTRNYAKKRNMPPKKGVEEKKVLLGRPGNNLKSGIV
jgi:hypothetical protein